MAGLAVPMGTARRLGGRRRGGRGERATEEALELCLRRLSARRVGVEVRESGTHAVCRVAKAWIRCEGRLDADRVGWDEPEGLVCEECREVVLGDGPAGAGGRGGVEEGRECARLGELLGALGRCGGVARGRGPLVGRERGVVVEAVGERGHGRRRVDARLDSATGRA